MGSLESSSHHFLSVALTHQKYPLYMAIVFQTRIRVTLCRSVYGHTPGAQKLIKKTLVNMPGTRQPLLSSIHIHTHAQNRIMASLAFSSDGIIYRGLCICLVSDRSWRIWASSSHVHQHTTTLTDGTIPKDADIQNEHVSYLS